MLCFSHRWIIRFSLIALPLVSLHGQRVKTSNDAPRTFFGVSLGILPSALLWDIPDQTITPITPAPAKAPFANDIWELRRELVTRRAVIQAQLTHFVSPHVGITGGFAIYSLKSIDLCRVVFHAPDTASGQLGDPALRAVCDGIATTSQGAQSSSAFEGGVVVRGDAHAVVQPYATGLIGLMSMSSSAAALSSSFNGSSLSIYRDPEGSNLKPIFTFGAGVATQMVPGLQAHVEVRESWIALSAVTGASQGQATVTPVATRYTGLFHVMVGLDLVLSRERGKRY